MSAFTKAGRVAWETHTPASWDHVLELLDHDVLMTEPQVSAIVDAFQPTLLPVQAEQLLAVAWDTAVLVSAKGTILSTVSLSEPPLQTEVASKHAQHVIALLARTSLTEIEVSADLSHTNFDFLMVSLLLFMLYSFRGYSH